jgi:N-acetylglucosamine-6-phosphate deacetylase
MLPTLISDDLDVIARGIAAVDDAIDAGVPGILGIHIEGPFLTRSGRAFTTHPSSASWMRRRSNFSPRWRMAGP